MKTNKSPTITKTVLEVFDGFEVGQEYSGLELKRKCVKQNPKVKYVFEETFLRILREKRRANFICIKRSQSKYLKIKN